jgi:methylmalonic aciduria homocystinuria type C protein
VEARLHDVGLDLCAELAIADYDAEVPEPLRLGRFGARGVLVGNTRALWGRFEPPLDPWVEAQVREAFPGAELRFAHHVPATVAIQRAAVVAGLAWLAPSHLCVHPVYGPWIALRALAVLDEPAPPSPPRVPPPCDCARGCGPALERAMAAGEPRTKEDLQTRWRLWVAVRDACPVGRAHRYSQEQIEFHYTGKIPGRE